MELITKDDCKHLISKLERLHKLIVEVPKKYSLLFEGENYLSGEDVCKILHISKRTLQEYRDTNLIPFIQLSGKMLYKESDIVKILNDNYIPAYPKQFSYENEK